MNQQALYFHYHVVAVNFTLTRGGTQLPLELDSSRFAIAERLQPRRVLVPVKKKGARGEGKRMGFRSESALLYPKGGSRMDGPYRLRAASACSGSGSPCGRAAAVLAGHTPEGPTLRAPRGRIADAAGFEVLFFSRPLARASRLLFPLFHPFSPF